MANPKVVVAGPYTPDGEDSCLLSVLSLKENKSGIIPFLGILGTHKVQSQDQFQLSLYSSTWTELIACYTGQRFCMAHVAHKTVQPKRKR